MISRKGCFIAVDFDGTCVDHRYPWCGPDVPDAVPVMREIQRYHKIILLTMRGRLERDPDTGLYTLDTAIRWFAARDLKLFDVNKNPTQAMWTDSGKVHAHVYVDDAAIGCPLKTFTGFHQPVVDWLAVRQDLVARELLE